MNLYVIIYNHPPFVLLDFNAIKNEDKPNDTNEKVHYSY